MSEIKKNDIINILINDVTLEGDGVGRTSDGRVVFCFGARKGETASMKIIKVTKNYLVGRLLSHSTITSENCPHYPVCGGCTLLHYDYNETLSLKENYVRETMARIGGIRGIPYDNILPSPDTFGYRNKTIYRFNDNCGCGFFRRNSHDVVEAGNCPLENEISTKIRTVFKELLSSYNIPIYSEKTTSGILREIMVRVSFSEKKAMLVIVVKEDKIPKEFIDEIIEKVPEISSLYVNVNASETNTLLGDFYRLAYGLPAIRDTIGPAVFEISPQSFFQVNPSQTERLYEKAFEYAGMKNGDSLLDLFCGIGTIGQYFAVRMADSGIKLSKLSGIEYTPEAIDNARKNVLLNNIGCETDYHAGDAGMVLSNASFDSTVCVVDPPRKGMDAMVIDAISRMPSLERLVYISCNPATLARDVKLFTERGFACEKVCPVDMFPFAGHVECVVLLSKHS